jgi:hypothetical protein
LQARSPDGHSNATPGSGLDGPELAHATSGQYAGAAHIFIMFCMYIEGDNFALPASDAVLCLYL